MVIFQQREKEILQLQQTRVQKQFHMFFYVLNINQNLLSMGQLIEKWFKVTFEDQCYHIYYATRKKILQVKMKGKNFLFFLTDKEHTTYSTNISITEI